MTRKIKTFKGAYKAAMKLDHELCQMQIASNKEYDRYNKKVDDAIADLDAHASNPEHADEAEWMKNLLIEAWNFATTYIATTHAS